MHPVVIDTNCLLQIISRNSPYRPIWDAFLVGKFDLCVSNDILEEYQEILEQQITPTVAENLVLLILNKQNVKLVDPHFRMGVITADPDDNKFVDCAFAANADYLVSEDSHIFLYCSCSFQNYLLHLHSNYQFTINNLIN